MPLNSPTRFTRFALAAAATGVIAGGAAVIVADAEPATAHAGQPGARYFDLEANKARNMDALGRHITARQTRPSATYRDLERNKARSQGAR